jgi:hypothetical protein
VIEYGTPAARGAVDFAPGVMVTVVLSAVPTTANSLPIALFCQPST